MPRLRFLSGAIVAALAFTSAAHAGQFDKVVVFGDSLNDNGNISLSAGAQQATRFTTNPGEVALEHVADAYGFTLKPSVLGGTDYAWGGAGVNNNAPGTPMGVPTVTQQIDGYLSTTAPDPHALYGIWSGANDIFYHASISAIGAESPTQALTAIAMAGGDEAGLIGKLQAAGASNIVVFNLPDIGKTPQAAASNAQLPGSAQFLTGLSQTYNQQLNQGLAQLGTGIIPVNAYAFLNEVIADPARYGFTNVTDPACGAGSSSVQCGPPGSGAPYTYPAGANSTYLFADGVHPSSAAHAILGQLVVSELNAPGEVSILGEAPLAAANTQARIVHTQMNADALGRGSRVFASVGYAQQGFNATSGSPSTHSHNTHVTVGVDGSVENTVSIGAALAYNHANADFGGHGGGYRMRNLMATGYAVAHLGGAYLGLYGGGGKIRFTDIKRQFALGPALRTESGGSNGSQWMGGLRTGFMFGDESLRSGPFVNVQWQHVHVDGYQENSSDSSAMHFGSQTRQSLVSSLGWRMTGNWTFGSGSVQPYLNLAWNHDSQADQRLVTAGLNSLNGQFALGGYKPDSTWVSADLGVSTHYDNITGWLGYTGRALDKTQTLNAFNIGVNIAF